MERNSKASPSASFILDRVSPEPNSGCWIWTEEWTKTGYGRTWRPGVRAAHRLSWVIFRGPIPDGQIVRHKCDVRACCNPDHLELGTHLDNSRDAVSRDRHARGERCGLAKLTDQQVIVIRRRVAAGEGQRGLAREYGVDRRIINLLCTGQTWKHLNEIAPPMGRGGRPGNYKLTIDQMKEVRDSILSGESKSSVSRRLGIGHASVNRAIRFLEAAEVQQPPPDMDTAYRHQPPLFAEVAD